jgi:hypothetical protein
MRLVRRNRINGAVMSKQRKALCELCEAARDSDMAPAPDHVVHPVTKKARVYDVHGIAKCPDCGAAEASRSGS